MKFQLKLVRTFSLVLLFISSATSFGQGFTIENKTKPSVVGAVSFVSLEGRFSVNLPPGKYGFSPLTTKEGKADGDSYEWKMQEGFFTVSHIDLPGPTDEEATSSAIFASIREGLDELSRANKGKPVIERRLPLGKYPGVEFKLEFPTVTMIQRAFIVSRRMYQALVAMENEERAHETLAIGALDTFKILTEGEVAKAYADKEAAATPRPLPQAPIAPRNGSDASDDGLRGSVKTVLVEYENLSATATAKGKVKQSLNHFNHQGNLLKDYMYDSRGNVDAITVYGYIDGARVSSMGFIEQEYNPPAVVVASEAGTKRNFDQRYTYKYKFKYDAQKRLIEKVILHSDGRPWMRHVYKYSGQQREQLFYSDDGSLSQRYVSVLDEKGNPVEEKISEHGKEDGNQVYSYEFDAKGNWTKQTESEVTVVNGKPLTSSTAVYYRTITYYE